jgi:hypothetical protein
MGGVGASGYQNLKEERSGGVALVELAATVGQKTAPMFEHISNFQLLCDHDISCGYKKYQYKNRPCDHSIQKQIM